MYLTFKSETHLGDCILHAYFLRQLIQSNPQIERIYLYQYDKHYNQVKEFLNDILNDKEEKIRLERYDSAPPNALRGWVGQFGIPHLPCALDTLRFNAYNTLCKQLNLISPFNELKDILIDHPLLYKTEQFDKYDVLLINSIPLSNQCSFDINEFNELAYQLKRKNKTVITTNKIEGIDCTLDKGYSVLDIGRLSCNAAYIIGIGTGPMICCLNKRNQENKFLYIDQHHYFDLPFVRMIKSPKQIEV